MNNNSPSSEMKETQLLELLTSLNQISEAINHTGPGDADNGGVSLQLIAESVLRGVPGAAVIIYSYDQAAGSFDAEARASAQAEGQVPSEAASQPDELGLRAIQRRQRMFSYEELDLDVQPAHATGCLPLIVAEQVVGLLHVSLHEKREFTQLEKTLLANFANQAAMAIYHTRRLTGVHHDLVRKEAELSRLHRAGLIISSRLRLKETLESILQLALEVTDARYGIFRLLDKSGEFLITSAVRGSHMDRPLIEKMPLNGNSVMAHVARTRQPALISDLRVEPWAHIYYPLDSNLKMLSELAVPLVNASGRLEGVLNLESPQVGAFTEDDSHVLQSLATYAITAIQEVRLLDALQEVARLLLSQPCQKVLDHLTTTANDLLNTSASAIWLRSADELILTAASGEDQPAKKLSLQGGLIKQAVLQKKKLTNTSNESGDGLRALIVPLVSGDDEPALGAFSVFSSESNTDRIAESEWDEKVLTCLAHYAALAIQNESHQQALRTSQEQHWTAETFAAVGDISANLLHNMNNKVGIIPVRVQGIQDKYRQILETDPYLTNSLNEIERSAMEAMQIVQENLSHLRPIRMEQVHIAACVLDAIRGVQIPAGIHINVEGLDDLPTVSASGQSLAFVFKNLIENASVAMQGNGEINVHGLSGPEWVEISVIDNGPGISPELHNQIFELNFSGRAGAQPGKLGFGLWWVKTLMTRLGGTVTVESDGLHGATFILRLPRGEHTAA